MTSLGEFLGAEPFTLAMSSGFFGFFAHAGVVRALERAGLVPIAYAGSSAGALIGALAASGHDGESLGRELRALRREDFWDPAPGAGLLRGERFRQRLGRLLPESFESCAKPLVVSAYDVGAGATCALRDGDLPRAIAASCAVPILFQPVRREGRWLLDGGLRDRPGTSGLSPGTRLLHHHLASRSPWRRPDSPALVPPRFTNGATLVIEGLPRSGPFALDAGPRAMVIAEEATKRALDRPIGHGVVRVGSLAEETRDPRAAGMY